MSDGKRRAVYVGSSSGFARLLASIATTVDVHSVARMTFPGLVSPAIQDARLECALHDNVTIRGEHESADDAFDRLESTQYDLVVVADWRLRRPPLDLALPDAGVGLSDRATHALTARTDGHLIFVERFFRDDPYDDGEACMAKFAEYVLQRSGMAITVHALIGGIFLSDGQPSMGNAVRYVATTEQPAGAYGYVVSDPRDGYAISDPRFAGIDKPTPDVVLPVPPDVRAELEPRFGRVVDLGVSADGIEIVCVETDGASAYEQCRALRTAVPGYTPVVTLDSVDSMSQLGGTHLGWERVNRQLDVLARSAPYEPPYDPRHPPDEPEQHVPMQPFEPSGRCAIVLVPDELGGSLVPLICYTGPQLMPIHTVARLRQWHESFGTSILFAGSIMVVDVERPPADLPTARALAWEHLAIDDNLQGIQYEVPYARWLLTAKRWQFWFD